jgi:hypothetical protein
MYKILAKTRPKKKDHNNTGSLCNNHFINYFLTLKNTTKEELEKEWNNTITIIREEQNKCKIKKQEGIVKEFLIERKRSHL